MATIPKAPSSPAAMLTAFSPPMVPADFARAIDLLTNFLLADARIHPDDLGELKALSAKVRASSNVL